MEISSLETLDRCVLWYLKLYYHYSSLVTTYKDGRLHYSYRNIGSVFIQSDWNKPLYRRIWGTILPSVHEDTNQRKSWYLPVQVMENQSMSGCVIMRASVEGGCSQCCWVWRWHSEGLQGCDLPPSHASCVNANMQQWGPLLLFPDHLTQN